MTTGTHRVLTHLRRVALLHDPGTATDGHLLERFLTRREPAAFEALLRRHGPMVLGVCRRVLHNAHDAEDAFQATFLVLVRRAASVLPRAHVGPWLYGVARRTALKARSSAARRGRAEQEAGRGRPATEPPTEASGDLRSLLDEEVARLAEKYRAPLVLCLLEGRPRKEAAGLLGCSEGTLSGRLARAKELLARRLRRRGVALTTAALAAALAGEAAAAPLPAWLTAATVKAAGAALAGSGAAGAVSAPVLTLTQEVLKAMLTSKLKAAVGVVLLVAGLGLGTGVIAWRHGPAAQGAGSAGEARPAGAAAARREGPPQLPDYVIEPPDILCVEYAGPAGDPVKITGQRLVRPDGTVGLGQLGSVAVAGRTVTEARAAIAEHLASRLDGFDAAKLIVDVVAYNSKVFYVIAEGEDGGEQVYRLPATGNETVLDALAHSKVSLVGLGRKRISIHRKCDGEADKELPVDWKGITEQGNSATNYLLRPGDRVHIKSGAPKKAEGTRRSDTLYVNRRQFALPYEISSAKRQAVEGVALLLSEDEGRTYRQALVRRPDDEPVFRVHLEHDGTYWFVVRVQTAGAAEPADVQGAPHLTVCVDTKPPEVTMRAERAGGKVDLSWEVTDDNLDVETLALRYRASGGDAWSSLPIPRVAHGRHSFVLPESIPGGAVDLRLEVRDRAGNVGARAVTLR